MKRQQVVIQEPRRLGKPLLAARQESANPIGQIKRLFRGGVMICPPSVWGET